MEIIKIVATGIGVTLAAMSALGMTLVPLLMFIDDRKKRRVPK